MPTDASATDADITSAVLRWLDDVVIGLQLCPFAATPRRESRLRVCVSAARSGDALLAELARELRRLHDTPAAELETTLIALPLLLADFADYNDFLDDVDQLLTREGWDGEFQVASFHPQYQFAGTAPDDADNLGNRAPVPLLHLLREASVGQAVDSHPDIDRIPEDNVRRLHALDAEQRAQLFPWLFPALPGT